ncbi:hypothetical protein FisN_33Lh028 [Fistulifera solaris]|uniref:Vacuolar protein sorting-associated protein 51 homolog n=1 Tax=Fistulifera solaris TaxID=1519565 RepID=A0A1Z5KA48_FISSO|nr:hypothetical protein FisN_33Lh028 [Fistulifera solaris]|eukprot:GAX23137.1 hypothetical protein FisN_33Lh028 [Fistulifera solaris]
MSRRAIESSSSSSSSSDDDDDDDDYLTHNKAIPREALVRQKLLENFYGKTPEQVWTPDDDDDDEEEDSDDDDDDDDDHDASSPNDLDAPTFDARQYTEQLIQTEPIQRLLEEEEQLALQVRTLDSTMQTMVYENYSRFIDATDAIRSIGVHVTANEPALQQLSCAVHQLDKQSKALEDTLGPLRDQVAEKIRVRRLLTRLDTLLKLPATLQHYVDEGQYQTATKSYTSAAPILAKHSPGFESLQKIETECQAILQTLRRAVQNKLRHWSGQELPEEEEVPSPPQSMMEIYECIGTMQLLLQEASVLEHQEETFSELESTACAASLRLLDRILDTHLIDVQERKFTLAESSSSAASLIATDYLNALLEASTLFKTQFTTSSPQHLVEFISEAFSSFLVHTKGILLEEQPNEANDEATQLVAEATTLLVQSVQDVADALQNIGIRSEWTAPFLGQATQLTESLTRRRVDQKFQALQISMVEDCWFPLGQRLADTALIPLVESTLADCLQLVDDTIRSCCNGSESPPDLKKALIYSVRKFCYWWANALEQMAGGESTRLDRLVEASLDTDDKTMNAFLTFVDEEDDQRIDNHASWQKLCDMVQALTLKEDGDTPIQLVLAVAMMCLQAESSVANSLEESIVTHLSGGKKLNKSRIMTGDMLGQDVQKRFQLARSTVFVLYASRRGSEMAHLLCQDVTQTIGRPKESTRQALAIAKQACQELNDMLQGAYKARDIPELESTSSRSSISPMARKKGLHLDIERMFQEKVAVFPHTSTLLDVNDVLFLVFKIALREWLEHIRLSIFSAKARSQVAMDAMLLKHLLPLYLNESQATAAGNIIEDCKLAAGDRMDGAAAAESDNEDIIIDAVRSCLNDTEWTSDFVLK